MQEPSIFTRIINGEIPCHKIYEDDRVIAFLDVHPLATGHTLVVPKIQIDHLWDLDNDDYDYLWNVSKKIATHIRETIKSPRVGVIVDGFGVPHAHIHLIPIYSGQDIMGGHAQTEPDNEALEKVAEQLRM